jgi:hypothetical protein
MTELEFDILDKLYFPSNIAHLQKEIRLSVTLIKDTLWQMKKKDWIKILKNYDEEYDPTEEEFQKYFENYHYIATKKGLMLHNSK